MLAVRLHRELLQVGGEALEVLLVGHHADRGGPEEVHVPDGEQAHQHREVLAPAGRCGSARPSRGTRPASRRTAPGPPPPSSTGRWPSPSSTARRPSPRSRTCSRCRSRTAATRSAFVETATKCLAIAAGSPSWPSTQSRAEVAFVSVSRVPKVFDDTMNSVSSAARSLRRLHEVGRVDVRDEAERQVAVAVVAQRLVRHHRAQVGSPDADIDDVADRLAGVSLPRTRTDLDRRSRPSGRGPRVPRRRRRRRRRSARCPSASAARRAAPSDSPTR